MNNLSKADLKRLVCEVLAEMEVDRTVPICISNHHIHLTEEHFQYLFPNETIEPLKPLKQPGEFASKQQVTLVGPRGEIGKVRILGPLRKKSQVEISKTDARKLGIDAPIRLSGNLKDAAEITLKTAANELTLPAAIVAKRHVHMNFKDMERLGLKKGQLISVEIDSEERTTIFKDVEIRVGENFVMEMHVDTDEANAANITATTCGKILSH